jgi:hypothetical protein
MSNTLRSQRITEKTLKKLIADIVSVTRIFLKVRKARELDNDLPRDDAYTVDNKSWRKLLDTERKAFKIVEQVAMFADIIEKGGSAPQGLEESDDEGDIESFLKTLK